MRAKMIFGLAMVLMLVLVPAAFAQYPEGSWYTSYQIQNLGTGTASVLVTYYDPAGVATAGPTFSIPFASSQVWNQYDDATLPNGRYSAVIESTEPIAVIANQQLLPTGATGFTPIPPFSSYSGFDTGATAATLPAIQFNWYGYYTEFYVQNIGTATANVNVAYYPGVMSGVPSGAAGVTESGTIPQFASKQFSQQSLAALGAVGGIWNGRFLGSAKVTSDQPIVVVVNQINVNQHKLFTHSGFAAGATEIGLPNYMRNHYGGYYASLTIGNPSDTNTAHVTLTYTADGSYSVPASGTVVVEYDIAPNTALVRYDGPTATDDQSDLDDATAFTRFFGTVKVTSNFPVVALVNQEAKATGAGQAGTYNGFPLAQATNKIAVPLIQADYYKYYTSLTIQNTTGTAANISIAYTSDSTYSAKPGLTKSYAHVIPPNGLVNIYEGHAGGVSIGDINTDSYWWNGTNKRFIGSAIITSDQPIIAFVNSEKPVLLLDSMYTFNAINIQP